MELISGNDLVLLAIGGTGLDLLRSFCPEGSLTSEALSGTGASSLPEDFQNTRQLNERVQFKERENYYFQ